MCSNLPKPGPAWHVQLKIWLLTGELYVRLGKCEEALACAQEAALLSPASHHVMYLVTIFIIGDRGSKCIISFSFSAV